jgi:hypothetical protein
MEARGMTRRQFSLVSLAVGALVLGLASPSAASTHVKIGSQHAVLASFNAEGGPSLACPPGKTMTCYLVGYGPGGTPPPGEITVPGEAMDFRPEIVPIHNGKPGTPVAFPGTESASLIGCGGGTTCIAAGYSKGTSAAAIIPISNGKPGTPVKVAGRIVWHSIECTASTSCIAVGSRYTTPKGNVDHGVIVAMNHGHVGAEMVITTASEIDGVSCTSTTACVAVGDSFSPADHFHGLFLTLNKGRAGKAHIVTKLGGLYDIACSWLKGTCVAGGEVLVGPNGSGGGFNGRVLIHGTKTTITELKSASNLNGSYVCAATGSCLAFGVVRPNQPGEHAALYVASKGKIGPNVTVSGDADIGELACSKVGVCTGVASELHGPFGDSSLRAFAFTY